jgi:TolB protein
MIIVSKMKSSFAWLVIAGLLITLSSLFVRAQDSPPSQIPETKEARLRNLQQLTFGGQNAEAYFSYDGTKIIFQSTRPPFECDQIFSMNVDGNDVKLLNSGKGRTTCGFFFPDRKRILYASTHGAGDACPPAPDRSQGYVWPIYPSYELFSANLDGSGIKRLTKNPGYDAEGTISPDGKKIVFTSMRSGDLDIYTMNTDGTSHGMGRNSCSRLQGTPRSPESSTSS